MQVKEGLELKQGHNPLTPLPFPPHIYLKGHCTSHASHSPQRTPPTSTPTSLTPSTSHHIRLKGYHQPSPPSPLPVVTASTSHTSCTSHSRRILGLDTEFVEICDEQLNEKGNFSGLNKVGHLAIVTIDSDDDTSYTFVR